MATATGLNCRRGRPENKRLGWAGGGRGAGVEPSPRAPWCPDGPGRTWFVSGGSDRPGSPLGPMDQAQVPRSGRILAGHTDAASAPNLSL